MLSLDGLFLEGGFDHQGRFVHLPTVDLTKMSACFRQRVIAFRFGVSTPLWDHVFRTVPPKTKPVDDGPDRV